MNSKPINTEYSYKSAFAANEDIPALAAAGWALSRATLFPFDHYDDQDQKCILVHISRFIAMANDPYERYLEFCQRILLAEEYFIRTKNTLRMKAPDWFRPSCSGGFEETAALFQRLLQKRERRPSRKRNWKTLAEAVMELGEEPTLANFDYWINWFKKRRACHELYIFIRAMDFKNFNTRSHEDIS